MCDELLRAIMEAKRTPDPLASLIRLCPECGSGDVHWCNISVRPYCAECHTWGASHFGPPEDAVKAWNVRVAKSGLEV
jgi:uncharacterized protein (DUF983 family)